LSLSIVNGGGKAQPLPCPEGHEASAPGHSTQVNSDAHEGAVRSAGQAAHSDGVRPPAAFRIRPYPSGAFLLRAAEPRPDRDRVGCSRGEGCRVVLSRSRGARAVWGSGGGSGKWEWGMI